MWELEARTCAEDDRDDDWSQMVYVSRTTYFNVIYIFIYVISFKSCLHLFVPSQLNRLLIYLRLVGRHRHIPSKMSTFFARI